MVTPFSGQQPSFSIKRNIEQSISLFKSKRVQQKNKLSSQNYCIILLYIIMQPNWSNIKIKF